MDLLDFKHDVLHFDGPLTPVAANLLSLSASAYGAMAAEALLLRAALHAPEHLGVLLALFHHYEQQGQLDEAALIAERCMAVAGRSLSFPADWREVDNRSLKRGITRSISLVRFYLLALKARACIGLRRREMASARDMLLKVQELDGADRLGAAEIIAIVDWGNGPANRGVMA